MSSGAANPFGEHLIPEPQPSKSSPDEALYMPWLHGPRVCPGKKLSQVEFVAVMARVFGEWMVGPEAVIGGGRGGGDDGKGKGGGDDGGLAALRESVEGAKFNLTPQLWRPERAGLRWVRRRERRH